MAGIREFLSNTQPSIEYYLMVFGGALIALFGILLDNIALLIASMIIAPLIQPIMNAAYAFVSGSHRIGMRSLGSFMVSVTVVIMVGLIGGLLLRQISVPLDERLFISFTPEPLSGMIIAIFGGMFATLGVFSHRIESIVSGVGLAVSLMPPLVVIGLGVWLGWTGIEIHAATIFLMNVVGILIGSVSMFYLMRKNIFGLRKRLED